MSDIKLRKEQLDALQKGADQAFVERLIAHFREQFGEKLADIDDPEFKRMVSNGVVRARSHGLTFESSIVGFVQLMFQVAPNFDEHPAFLRVLDDRTLEENDRIQAIFKRVSREEWKQAQEQYDDDAWDQGPGHL